MSDEDLNWFAFDSSTSDETVLDEDCRANKGSWREDLLGFPRKLAAFNAVRLAPAKPVADWQQAMQEELALRLAEGEFIEQLRLDVRDYLPSRKLGAEAFMAWFEALADDGPGQRHPLFPWLAEHADLQQMRWFLRQEAAGEAGFDDLLAYTQVKLPQGPKLEFARNFWDEMGHGKPRAMHSEMLGAMVRELDLRPAIDSTVCESLALANTMVAFATTRRYAFHSIGALGVIELTAPGRVKRVAEGMKRLGFDGRMRAYFDLHAVLDVHHSKAWNEEIIRPLVEADPDCARYIAEGALMRLLCGERCFNRYSQTLMHEQHA